MKKLLLLLLIFTTQAFSQTSCECDPIPCAFSWADAPTTNGQYNFVTPPREQPYQGPCLAFAFNAAIETVYAIENNIDNPTMNLSDAYLDYKVWNPDNFAAELNNRAFKITMNTGEDGAINAFAKLCQENYNGAPGCAARSIIIKIIDNDAGTWPPGQHSYSYTVEGPVGDYLIQDAGGIGNYATVNTVTRIYPWQINSNDNIKTRILDNGPMVLKVSGNDPATGNHNSSLFVDYPPGILQDSNLNYHAFAIIGWTQNNEWIIKDSWPGVQPNTTIRYARIRNTKPNVNISQLLDDNYLELYQVSGVEYNGLPSGPAAVLTDCPIPPEPDPFALSNISVDVDYATIGGNNYGKFWVTSNYDVDRWVWGIAYPYSYRKRSQVNQAQYSSVLLSPNNSGYVTVYVRAYKDGVTYTKERSIYLFNSQSGGGGGGGGGGPE